MKNVNFIRINKYNMNLIPSVIDLDGEKVLKKNIEKFVSNDNNYCFVGILENNVVAFLYGYGMLRPDGKSMFYIHSVDVIKEYQNNGIGTELIDYVLNYIKDEKKYCKFFVLAQDDNIRACKVYQKYADKEGQVLFSKLI